MSFYFANQSKKNIYLGHSKSNNISLQKNKPATFYNFASVTNTSVLLTPIIHDKFVAKPCKAKRTFLFTHLTGSITIEASLILPIFIFALMSIMYFFNILYIHTTLQIQLENISRLINASTCITTAADVNINSEENSLLEKVIIDASGTIAINSLFLTDEIKAFADNSLIIDGHKGLSFLGSDVTNTSFPLNIVLSYRIRMPFISEDIFAFNIKQNCYFKPFTGKRLSDNTPLDERYVYVTTTGESFHENKYCTYLERCTYIKNLGFLLKDYPNISACSLCTKDSPLFSYTFNSSPTSTFVYIGKEYDVYHYFEYCPHLEHSVTRMTYEDASQDYSPCSRCTIYSN